MRKSDPFDALGLGYDPEVPPDPAQWLGLDEQTRILLVQNHHQAARIRLPKPQLHYAMHVVVENQIAEGFAATVNAMQRLRGEGLSRHDALHAIAAVVGRRIFEMLTNGEPQASQAFEEQYSAELDKLTAAEWRKLAG